LHTAGIGSHANTDNCCFRRLPVHLASLRSDVLRSHRALQTGRIQASRRGFAVCRCGAGLHEDRNFHRTLHTQGLARPRQAV